MTVRIEPIDPYHARNLILAENADRLSEEQVGNLNAVLMLAEKVNAGFKDDRLVCVWGVRPTSLMSERAYLWVWVSPDLEGNEFLFIRHSKLAVESLLKVYPTIWGYCEEQNTKAQDWIKWLGGEFIGTDKKNRLLFVIGR